MVSVYGARQSRGVGGGGARGLLGGAMPAGRTPCRPCDDVGLRVGHGGQVERVGGHVIELELRSVVVARPVVERCKGVTDLLFAGNGGLYFTDQGQSGRQDPTGRLYRLRAEGGLDCLLDNVPSPNGLVMDRAETMVFLAVTRGNCVWRVPLLLDGRPSKVGVFINMSGGAGPDGMALDMEGNLAVCHPGLGTVWLFSPTGEPLYRIRSCTGLMVTNCAYGGPENRSLFITESDTGTVLRAELPVAGCPMYLARNE